MIDSFIERVLYARELSPFTTKDKVFFYRELAFLLEWWVSEVVALDIVKKTSEKTSLQYISESLMKDLNQGESFAAGMMRLPTYFPESDVYIVKSWEALWQLTLVLKYLANEYEFLSSMRNKYISAVMYPVLLFVVSCIAIYALFTTILPWIFDMVKQFEWVEIPATTQFLMQITWFLSLHGSSILISLAILIFWWSILFSTEDGKRYLDTLSFQLPIIGTLTKQYSLITFLRYMKLLIYSGMQYVDVFWFLKDIMGNSQYKDAIQDVIDGIQVGQPIAGTLLKHSAFIPMDVIMLLRVGEETASFDRALENAIRMYEDEFQKSLDGLSKLLEPILIVFVWWIIAMIAVSVFWVIGNLLWSLQA